MSCYPSYNYVPDFAVTPAGQVAPDCAAPGYAEHRSRLFVGGTYFRSKLQGSSWNSIQIRVVDNLNGTLTCSVTHPDYPTETYTVTQTAGALPEDPCSPSGIGSLRTAISNNTDSIVEMYTRGLDINDLGGEDDPCLSPFTYTPMSGGSGGPSDSAGLAAIRTGPSRSIIIIRTQEDINGNPVTPPASKRVQQWNGTAWISYCNNVPGECPGEGTC
jgi:hypothetical protein